MDNLVMRFGPNKQAEKSLFQTRNEMDQTRLPEWVTLLGLIIFSTTIVALNFAKAFQHRRIGQRLSLPPGPRGWPIVGSLPYLSKDLLVSVDKLRKKHGPIMLLHLGSVPAVVLSSSKIAKEVLQTNDSIMSSRPQPPVAANIFSYNSSDVLWAPYGKYWRVLRKFFSVKLLSMNRIRQFQESRRKEILHLFSIMLIDAQDGQVVNMRTYLANLTFNSMSAMVLGKRFCNLRQSETETVSFNDNRMLRMFQHGVHLSVKINVADAIPWLKPLDLQKVAKEAKKVQSGLDQYLQTIIDQHSWDSKQPNPDAGADKVRASEEDRLEGNFVEQLLEVAAMSSADFPDGLGMSQIKAILLNAIGASLGTCTSALEWTLAELLKHPAMLKSVQKELDTVVGPHRLVEEADLPHLDYLQAVIKESLRLHPPVPMSVPHQSIADCQIGGYHVPSGTPLFINILAINTDPQDWEQPLEFRPERFLASSVDVTGRNFECLPFTSGRRSCPGMNLALHHILYSLSQLLHSFDWELPGDQHPEELDMSTAGQDLFTNVRCKPLELIPKPRCSLSISVIKDAARAMSVS